MFRFSLHRATLGLVISLFFSATHAPAAEPRTLRVDARGGADYRTLAEAARAARPGDTIAVAPGSGPYREELFIPLSGTPEAPIIFDGGGETITGLEPITFSEQDGAQSSDLKPLFERFRSVQQFHREPAGWVNDNVPPGSTAIPPLPTVLVYRGERLRQDAATGQLTRYATLSPDGSRLTLLPGTSAAGWELASRPFAVRISDTSHQIYRNLKASGSLNDGINAHGTGEGLVFEHIEAFHNLDEGFSSHDHIVSEIRGGRFWENDNGVVNATSSSTRISDVDIFSNLGIGFGLLGDASAQLDHVRIWENGISQFSLESRSRVECHDVTIYQPGWTTRQWISTQETRLRPGPVTLALNPGSVISGDQPMVLPAASPTR
ncbi:hypothetical protein DB345_06170 [Spartobacteria bacterium LR76]|nr:hypothetical protein DB345_06170 [Spartobacteria bacterium LR76]